MKKEKWYRKKKIYIPLSIILGVLGFGASLVSLFGVSIDDELNKDYYKDKDEPLFKKKND